jgi:adenylate cyclase
MSFKSIVAAWLICGICISTSKAQTLTDQINAARAITQGPARIERLLEVSNAALQEKAYDQAFDLAEEAESSAKRAQLPMLRARALHQSGKVLLVTSRRKGLFRKDKPAPRFKQSNEILERIGQQQHPLYKENQALLAALESGGNAPSALNAAEIPNVQAPSNVSNMPRPAIAPNNGIPAGGTDQAVTERLLAENKALLMAKEAAINQMSESQVKVELMLMQQRQILDSLLFRSKVDSLAISNQNLALHQAQTARNFSYALAGILLLSFCGALYSVVKVRRTSRQLAQKNVIIAQEHNRAEQLLLNVLPRTVADELKAKGHTQARFYEQVTVLFADFVNFTKIAEQTSPQGLVTDLDTCFKAFDQIIGNYGLEKIKTVGDAYLCAGGLFNPDGPQTVAMVHAARDMQIWLDTWNAERARHNQPAYQARIGVHLGPVVAGVVGAQKFAFDIWGDTVNTAARIEQASEPGRVNLSQTAYNAVKTHLNCTYRGKLPAKNKGEIEMYFLDEQSA